MAGIVEGLKQNTPEWHEFRKGKIGASLAPIIMGVSKWCTPWQLYMRKLGLIPEQEDNLAMANGRAKEAEALDAFNERYECNCKPIVMQHDEYPWMIASLDGWYNETKVAVEIKCPGLIDQEYTETFKEVPPHYYSQLQHQLAVTGKIHMYYWSWYKGKGFMVTVARDESYIEDMIAKEMDFMRRLRDLDPPTLTDRDYVENHSREWRHAVSDFNSCRREKERIEREYEKSREELIRLSADHNCKGSGLRVTKSARKGNIEYNRIPELEDIDLEQYRKPPITTWRVTEE